ncbi:hypothetical protein [Helicobacter marmotae]|uniref:hypothetical protein n=1 Tax=Helicobacter marmotae TaxID=152490 RepID=UPI0013151C5E|nr:hypothetical protein [Helicobacter marmotae]
MRGRKYVVYLSSDFGGGESLQESLVVLFGVFESNSLADKRDSSPPFRAPSE